MLASSRSDRSARMPCRHVLSTRTRRLAADTRRVRSGVQTSRSPRHTTYDEDSIAPAESRQRVGHAPAHCLAMARCAGRPLGMASAGVDGMGRQTVGPRLAPHHGNSRAGGDAGGGGDYRCRSGRLVVHASDSALRELLGDPARPDGVRRHWHLIDQTVEDRVQ